MWKRHDNKNTSNKLLNYKKISFLILCLTIYLYFRSGVTYLPVEELDIPSGIGTDLTSNDSGDLEFSIPISFYNYGGDKEISRLIRTGVGSSIAETRETRQLLSDKKMVLGLERVVIFNEEYSRFGIKNVIDIMFKNPLINDTALVAICKGKSEDILSYRIPKYPSAADNLEGILKHSTEFNFFSENYKAMDIFTRMEAEGRNIALPYIELIDNELKITGMALFKKDKMVRKIEIDESKAMNMLRENKVRGMLTLQESLKEYISYYALTKRRVRCEKKDDYEYDFFIDLSLTGEIVDNSLYHDIHKNDATMKIFELNMVKYVEKICNDFIKEMQENYKVDCLELGRVAAAKYGRQTGVDWDEIVSNSNIKVNVNVKVDRMGRGDY